MSARVSAVSLTKSAVAGAPPFRRQAPMRTRAPRRAPVGAPERTGTAPPQARVQRPDPTRRRDTSAPARSLAPTYPALRAPGTPRGAGPAAEYLEHEVPDMS